MATVAADAAQRSEIIELVGVFRGEVVNVGPDRLTVMLAGSPDTVDDFERLLGAYRIVELQRTGRVALPSWTASLRERLSTAR